MAETAQSMITKSPDAEQAVGGALWAAASQLVPIVATAALSVVIGRHLGAEQLGRQTLVVYVEAVLTTVALGSCTDASIRALAAHLEDGLPARRLVTWTASAQLLSGAVVAAVLAAIGLAEPASRRLWWLVAISTLANAVGWFSGTRRIVYEGWSRVGRFRLVSQTSSGLLGIGAVVSGLGISGVIGANVVVAAGLAVVLAPRVPGPKPTKQPGPLPKAFLRLWLMFAAAQTLVQVVNQRIEFVFLGLFSTDVQVAQYSIPFALVAAATTAVAGLLSAALPALARTSATEPSRLPERLGRLWRIVAAISVPVAVLVAALGPSLVGLVYGPGFGEAGRLVPLMAVSALFSPLGYLCNVYWSGLGRLGPALTCGGIAGLLDVALAAALIPRGGALGATIANICGQSLAGLLLSAFTWRRNGRFPLGTARVVTVVLSSVVAGAVGKSAASLVGGWIGLLAGGALASAVIVGVGFWRGYLMPSDTEWLERVLPRRLSFVALALGGR